MYKWLLAASKCTATAVDVVPFMGTHQEDGHSRRVQGPQFACVQCKELQFSLA